MVLTVYKCHKTCNLRENGFLKEKLYLILPPFHIVNNFRKKILFQNVSSFYIST